MAAHDPKEIFLQALRFEYSSLLLGVNAVQRWNHGGGIVQRWEEGVQVTFIAGKSLPSGVFPPTIVSSFVCESFAVELYLKTVLCLENCSIPKKHTLDFLFEQLPQHWRDRILNAFDEAMKLRILRISMQGKSLKQTLAESATAFEKWRYSFEGVPPNQYLAGARLAIRNAIIAAKPEWEELRRNLDTPPKHPDHLTQVPASELHWSLSVGSPQLDSLPQVDSDRVETESEHPGSRLDHVDTPR